MVILGKKSVDEINEKLNELEESVSSLNDNNSNFSSTIKELREKLESSIQEITEKLRVLDNTISNLTENGEKSTLQQTLKEYFYGKQGDDNS